MRKLALLLTVTWLLLPTSCMKPPPASNEAAPQWSLLPIPAVLHPSGQGAVVVDEGDQIMVEAPGQPAMLDVVERLVQRVALTRGLQLQLGKNAEQARIVFRLSRPTGEAVSGLQRAAYQIDIGGGQIVATAATPRGLFYASVTVGQLLTPNHQRGPVRVANGTIRDQPRFAWRGFMLDSARHFQKVSEIKQIIDWMSLHKLNVLHWHLDDDQGWRLQIKQYPRLTSEASCRRAVGPDAVLTGSADEPYCGYYSQADVRELVAYAAERFITIVPEIEIPGHAQAALHAYPELGSTGERPPVSTDWGINSWLYAPDEDSIRFLQNVLDEVMVLFPSRYIHIGGDEAPKSQWEASPAARAKQAELGLPDMDALQGWMVDRIGAYLAEHGRILVGWDEILAGGALPESAVVMSWRGVEGAIQAAQAGHDTILAPSPDLYLDHVQSGAHREPAGRPGVVSLESLYHFQPVPAQLTQTQSEHVLGLQANLWTEYMPTFARAQHAVFPRMSAWAEVAWSQERQLEWSDFVRRMPAQLARYRALGIAYADSAWGAQIELSAQGKDIRVEMTQQIAQGSMYYTTDGSKPSPQSARYREPLLLPSDRRTQLQVAVYAQNGQLLARPRSRDLSAASLYTRNSDQLSTCSKQIPLRIEDDRPLDGPRPVYKVDIANTCWVWKAAPLEGMRAVRVRVGNLPWNYALPYAYHDVVARPTSHADGELEFHLGTCDGALLARIPLTDAAETQGQTVLQADLQPTDGQHDLCIFATGDPRKGRMWALDTVRLLPATEP